MPLLVKICGITSPEDARWCVEVGADAIGVNLIATSKRYVGPAAAKAIVAEVCSEIRTVAVVADLCVEDLRRLRSDLGVSHLQLHGNESADMLAQLLPGAYKAIPIATAQDVTAAAGFPGEEILVDTKVQGQSGGTGLAFDWQLVTALALKRHLWLAGGLDPSNVGRAVREVRPFGVDVASGVESSDPRRKDPERMKAFVLAARQSLP